MGAVLLGLKCETEIGLMVPDQTSPFNAALVTTFLIQIRTQRRVKTKLRSANTSTKSEEKSLSFVFSLYFSYEDNCRIFKTELQFCGPPVIFYSSCGPR